MQIRMLWKMTEQATLNENASENDLNLWNTADGCKNHGRQPEWGFLKKWLVRVGISKVIAMRSKIVPGQFCYFLSIVVEFMQ